MNKPLVSVLMSSYNHEKYVQETIYSIINQTYQNIELIIIDDGSKDSTWHKIQEMRNSCEARFTRVHFETKENEGICKTLNKLLALAKGEYVYIIASDDLAKPTAIEKEVNFLNNNPEYSLVVGNNEIIDGDGRICYWNKKRQIIYDEKKARTKNLVEYLKRHNDFFNDKDFGKYSTIFRGNYIPNGYLIRKSIYDVIGNYPEGLYVEDWWFMLQLSKFSKMKYIDEIFFSYRWHNSNTIKNVEKMSLLSKNTLEWEENYLKNTDRTNFIEDVSETYEKGVLYKQMGIPFIFEIKTVKKGLYKIREIRLFNVKIKEIKSNY